MKRIFCYLFGHQYKVSRIITPEIAELFCNRCKKQFAIHTGVKTLLPLDMDLFEMHNDILRDRKLNSEPEVQECDTTKAPSEPQTPETISHLKQISACFDSILSHQTDDVIEFDAGACLYKIFNTARIGKQLADAVVKNV